MDIREYNSRAWDKRVAEGDQWTVPVSSATVDLARGGDWSVFLTEQRPVPREWFPELEGIDVLCLACGGGQQGPLFAAAGANVTVFDSSPAQLAQDRLVAERDGLEIRTVEGDMSDLSAFADGTFDLVFHPVSNMYVPDVRPVWAEASRVLRVGGLLLAGFHNPLDFIFDFKLAERGALQVRHQLPYSDVESLTEPELRELQDGLAAMEFSHTLVDMIAGQTDVGLALIGFYEDRRPDYAPARYMPTYFATRAVKL